MFTTVLSKNATRALALLGKNKVLPLNTYLAGGSSLALQFGHRISVDFDFFTPSQFKSDDIVKRLNSLGDFSLQEAQKENTILGLFNNVRFSLFLYNYPLIFKPIKYLGINLADPRDIVAMKLVAIMDRGTKKDYIDLYFLNKKGIKLDKAFKYYDKKYHKLANNIYSLLKSLVYFDEAEISDMPKMIEKVNWEEVKSFFKKEVVRLANKYIYE